MAFTVVKLSDEPILLVAVDFSVVDWLRNLHSLKGQVGRYAQGEVQPLHVILNLQRQDLNASDVQLLVYDAQDEPFGSIADSHVRAAVVGDHPLIEMLQRKVNQAFAVPLPQFETIESALVWARASLAAGDD